MKAKTPKPEKITVAKSQDTKLSVMNEAAKTIAEPVDNPFIDEKTVLAYSLYGEILFEL